MINLEIINKNSIDVLLENDSNDTNISKIKMNENDTSEKSLENNELDTISKELISEIKTDYSKIYNNFNISTNIDFKKIDTASKKAAKHNLSLLGTKTKQYSSKKEKDDGENTYNPLKRTDKTYEDDKVIRIDPSSYFGSGGELQDKKKYDLYYWEYMSKFKRQYSSFITSI